MKRNKNKIVKILKNSTPKKKNRHRPPQLQNTFLPILPSYHMQSFLTYSNISLIKMHTKRRARQFIFCFRIIFLLPFPSPPSPLHPRSLAILAITIAYALFCAFNEVTRCLFSQLTVSSTVPPHCMRLQATDPDADAARTCCTLNEE